MVAAAAAEKEGLRHMRPASRVTHADDAAAEEELGGDDGEILRFMDSADGYLLLMDSLSSALRQVPRLTAVAPLHQYINPPPSIYCLWHGVLWPVLCKVSP
jgi:hypothetical protein